MYPLLSARNVTPISTGASAPASGVAGVELLGQMVHGQEPDPVMEMLNAWVADLAGLLESLAFAVKVKVPGVVGVPEIVPVLLRDRPAGKDPLAIDHVYGVTPPVAARVVE